jgi:molybdopterin synthase sulfur carrier subunit
MSTIRVPPVLRKQIGGAKEVKADGATVGDVLHDLAAQYPALESHLFQDGDLQRYVNVYINDQDIQYLQRLETPAAPEDTIIILPAMAGG